MAVSSSTSVKPPLPILPKPNQPTMQPQILPSAAQPAMSSPSNSASVVVSQAQISYLNQASFAPQNMASVAAGQSLLIGNNLNQSQIVYSSNVAQSEILEATQAIAAAEEPPIATAEEPHMTAYQDPQYVNATDLLQTAMNACELEKPAGKEQALAETGEIALPVSLDSLINDQQIEELLDEVVVEREQQVYPQETVPQNNQELPVHYSL